MARKKKVVQAEMDVASAVSDAFEELQMLAEEMRSWEENIQEKFSQTEKYERVNEAADNLEALEEPTVPEKWASERKITVVVNSKARSRPARRDEACNLLYAVIEACDEWIDENEAAHGEVWDEVSSFRDDVERLKDDAEQVDFPGMYG